MSTWTSRIARGGPTVRPVTPRASHVMVAVAATYAAGRLLAGAVGQAIAPGSSGVELPSEVAAAVVVGATLGWLAPMVTGSSAARTGSLTVVLFASVAAVMLEGSAFAPSLSPIDRLPLELTLQLGVSLSTAAVAVALSSPTPGRPPASRPSILRLGWGVVASALVYVAAYFVTGAVNYALVTGPYYATHAGVLVTPPPSVVLAVAVIEGLALALGTVPLARRLAGPRWTRALVCGLTLWVLGGLVPLLQAASLPDVLRVASAIEILFQKWPLGIAVVWLTASRWVDERGPIGPRDIRRTRS